MIEKQYLDQLQKIYPRYLTAIIEGFPFEPITLRGGKNKPLSTKELEETIRSFLLHQKSEGRRGWEVSWEAWSSKKLGNQQWPSAIAVTTEADLLYLLKKEKEAAQFRAILEQLNGWNAAVNPWLALRPFRVLELKEQWKGICAVVDYLLQHDVTGKYIRSLPVPVHTKFIQQNSTVILSLLKHLAPERFASDTKILEDALGLQRKPVLCTLRWLDPTLAASYTSGIEVVGVTLEALCQAQWKVREIWVVENETNLYLLPPRPGAIALFGKGYAVHDLKAISMLQQSRLIYWGDLDEDGFRMLSQFRQMYPHAESILMDDATVLVHAGEIHPVMLRHTGLMSNLAANELKAWEILREKSGRIEQEQIRHDWMLHQVRKFANSTNTKTTDCHGC